MKNLILVSQVFYPSAQSTSLLFTDLALSLRGPGIKITTFCGFPNSPCDHLITRHDNLHGIDIYRCGANINFKAGLWQRFFAYGSFLIHAGWKLITFPEKDIVIGVSNPPFLSIILMIVSIFTGCKYHFVMHDVYPEGLVAIGRLNEKSVIRKVWHKLNQLSYFHATKIVVLGRDMKDLLIKSYSVAPDKIECITNWSLIVPNAPNLVENNELACKLNIQDKFIVQYSGNMGLWHDIDTFVYAAAKVSSNSNIQFLFIGNGIRQKQAQQLAKDLGLKNIIWIDFLPQDQLETSLTCSHVALISLNKGLEGIAVPCKLYGILASGRAILAQVPESSEIAYTVNEESCGFVVSPGDVDGLVEKIQCLAVDRKLTSEMGCRSFNAYKSKYNISFVSQQFQRMLGMNFL
jgi:glycosyltransferase involved in cell wall biosynthesis